MYIDNVRNIHVRACRGIHAHVIILPMKINDLVPLRPTYFIFIGYLKAGGGHGGFRANPMYPNWIRHCLYTDILVASYMSMQLVCTSKNIWAELSYEFGPSCLINLGRVGMGRVLSGPSWHGPSWFWAELSVILYNKPGTNTEPHNGNNTQQRINNNRTVALERQILSLLFVRKRNIVRTPV